ncbi:ankyrin repeat domain-containing protein [Magnetospirillum sp. SS-4]|uniref:ankyrin repeat domain-containing protein n=1 Tax=Magnetospirillum sp. SS-4 TaxID=2681465 RepID=UPI0013846E39|nr:ankyrin repeat domain-containing protein [Magnetospirillum sp. SS-4]CAA7615066.1 conserved hypothetical protein [Magnetospirillum sp. SS-4]
MSDQMYWDGVMGVPENANADALAMRHELADAAKSADWNKLLTMIGESPELINAIRPGGNFHYTPLHQAAYSGAPVAVIRRLLDLGASRTLKNRDGETAQEIARRRGHAEIEKLLAPERRVQIDPDVLSRIQGQFHRLIRGRANWLIEEGCIRLPDLECLTELEQGKRVWFAVPGMHGGFLYWFSDEKGTEACLCVESWCRVADGSERGHLVYADRVMQTMTGNASGDLIPAFCVLSNTNLPNLLSYAEAYSAADSIVEFMTQPGIFSDISRANVVDATSHAIQIILKPHLQHLGFSSEQTDLFAAYGTKSLRPDYFRPYRDGGGILIEVERGKTLENNMDLLDLWKCHICTHANYLIIIVPKIRNNKKGNRTLVFDRVVNRLTAFFQYGNEVNVDAAFVIGY